MKTIHTEPGLAQLQYDPDRKLYVIHWSSYHGPHYRRTLEAMLAEVKKTGLKTYITDASLAKDVPLSEDFEWVEKVAKPALVKGGLEKFITVLPASAIAKMTTTRIGKVASSAGLEICQAHSMEEALKFADGRKAA